MLIIPSSWGSQLGGHLYTVKYHPKKANVIAGALGRKVYAKGITVGELSKGLCEQFKDLRLELVPDGYLAAMEVKPTLLDMIREA
jgi:hypothetical protein